MIRIDIHNLRDEVNRYRRYVHEIGLASAVESAIVGGAWKLPIQVSLGNVCVFAY